MFVFSGMDSFRTCWPHDEENGSPIFNLEPKELAKYFDTCNWRNNALFFGGLYNIQIRNYFNIFDKNQFCNKTYFLFLFMSFIKAQSLYRNNSNFIFIRT